MIPRKVRHGAVEVDGTWFARWTCSLGKEHRGVATTAKEARAIAANMSQQPCAGHRGRGRQPKLGMVGGPTFQQVAEEWLVQYPALRTLRPATVENYASMIEQHLIPALGHLPITAVDAPEVEGFIVSRRQGDRKLADSTLGLVLVVLKLILKRATKRKLIPSSPMPDVEWKSSTHRGDHADPFMPSELRAIFTAAEKVDTRWSLMLRTWAGCGARHGEVTGLQWRDVVDLQRGMVQIHQTYSRKRLGPTKTGRDRTVSFLHPVSVDTPRVQPQDDGLVAALAAIQGPADHFIFGGVTPLDSARVRRRWVKTLKLAQVRYREPEQLRHTFASILLSRGAPKLYVRKVGGWKSDAVLDAQYSRYVEQGETLMERWLAERAAMPRELAQAVRP